MRIDASRYLDFDMDAAGKILMQTVVGVAILLSLFLAALMVHRCLHALGWIGTAAVIAGLPACWFLGALVTPNE